MRFSAWSFGSNWSVAQLCNDPVTTLGYGTDDNDDKLLLYKSMFSEKK